MKNKCEVKGCTASASKFYNIPKKSDPRFNAWIDACGNPDLRELPANSLRNRLVCGVHFEERFKLSLKLSRTAVPTLNLPEAETTVCVASTAVPAGADPAEVVIDEPMPSTSAVGRTASLDAMCTTDQSNSRKPGINKKRRILKQRNYESIAMLFHRSRKDALNLMDRKAYNAMAALQHDLRRATRRVSEYKKRLSAAEDMYVNHKLEYLLDTVPQAVRSFITMNVRNANVSKHSRVFTTDDKVLALALQKRCSSSAYRFLSKLFVLPSEETLRKLVTDISLHPGINDCIFKDLELRGASLSTDAERCAVLLFDEMKLTPSLAYNTHNDEVTGFVDNGIIRRPIIADHVMVWMIRGVSRPWKQPVVFTFCKGSTSWEDIAQMYRIIVRRCFESGIKIIASVCDQGMTNGKAIRQLIFDSQRTAFQSESESAHPLIRIDGHCIIPLYDVPHLLKCLRNNLLTKDLEFSHAGVKGVAKWSHIQDAFFIDQSRGPCRLAKKITHSHIDPSQISKMRVKFCAQIFSHTFGSLIDIFARSNFSSACSSKQMQFDAIHTSQLCLFLNELFDSLNYKKAVASDLEEVEEMFNSIKNLEIWNNGIETFRSMTFIKRKSTDKSRPEVLKNWIHTLNGFKFLQNSVDQFGLVSLETRAFNQDPLENFFGQIRQHRCRDVNPTCSNFINSYRTLLLNSYAQVLKNSRGTNCESDGTVDYLTDLRNFVIAPVIASNNDNIPDLPVPVEENLSHIHFSFNDYAVKVLPHIHKQFTNCVVCLQNVSGQTDTFCKQIEDLARRCYYYMPTVVHCAKVANILAKAVIDTVDFTFVPCEHVNELPGIVVNSIICYVITDYVKTLTNIARGRVDLPPRTDALMVHASAIRVHKL